MKEIRRNKIVLPNELLEIIFLLLSRKLLVHLRGVCKDWKSLIESPEFAQRYHKQLPRPPMNQSVVLVSVDEIYKLDMDEFDGRNDFVLANNASRNTCGFGVIGSCDNFLCFLDTKCELSLYNPTTNKRWCIPLISEKPPTVKVELKVFGFGYDGSSYDYKVVRVLWFSLKNSANFNSLVHVYSLRRNSWKIVDSFAYKPKTGITTHGVYVSNALHWLILGNFSSSSKQIASFDLGSEKFSSFGLPVVSEDELDYMTMHSLNGLLGLCVRPLKYHCFQINIWVMENYERKSWTKLFTVRSSLRHMKPIALLDDHSKVLMCGMSNTFYRSYGDHVDFRWYDENERLTETTVTTPNAKGALKVETCLGSNFFMN